MPSPRTPLLGREEEREQVQALLQSREVRWLTLTGPGGIGKTRLAQDVATNLSHAFQDGIVFVPLATVRDPELVLTTVAQALNMPEVTGQSLPGRLQAYLREQHLLLVLDNLEHLLEAVPGVAQLLDQAPQLKVCCTSRIRIDVAGEHIYPVPALPAAAARQLFVQRAEAQGAVGLATVAQETLIDAICDRLDQLPLAIELAAARTAVLDLPELMRRLDHQLPLLTGGPRDAPARQRTMRDAIAWSHDLLDDREQVALRRLSVCIGGFTLNAANRIAGDGTDALDVVESLVAKSLVVRSQATSSDLRFRMLETIREYAFCRLQENEEIDATWAVLADWLVALTEAALPHYDGPDVRHFRDAVMAEFDNIRAVLSWLIDTSNGASAIRLAGAIWRNWWAGTEPGSDTWWEYTREGLSWIERALSLGDDLPIEHITEALAGGIFLSRLQEQPDKADAYACELLHRSQAAGYAYGELWAWHGLTVLAQDQGDLDRAFTAAQRAHEMAPHVRNPENHAAITLLRLGEIAEARGGLDAAESYLRDAEAHVRTCDNPHMAANIAYALGRTMRRKQRHPEATAAIVETLELLAVAEDRGRAPFPLLELAQSAAAQGQPASAIRLLASIRPPRGNAGLISARDQVYADLRKSVPQSEFEDAWEAGQRLSWDEVMDLARSLTVASDDAESTPPTRHPHGLTPREHEVLQLLAEGRSNRGIAEVLSLSERTVESHVLHVLTKLDLESRAAAAAFAVRNGIC